MFAILERLIMRDIITTSLKDLGQNRTARTVYGLLIAMCVVAAIYFSARIRVSDILVTTHYTSFGGVNFYASQWWYAIGFVLFFVIIACVHTAIGIKLSSVKNSSLSVGFGLFSIALVVFATITLTYIINVAFPV